MRKSRSSGLSMEQALLKSSESTKGSAAMAAAMIGVCLDQGGDDPNEGSSSVDASTVVVAKTQKLHSVILRLQRLRSDSAAVRCRVKAAFCFEAGPSAEVGRYMW